MSLRQVIKRVWYNYGALGLPLLGMLVLEWPIIKREVTRIIREEDEERYIEQHLAAITYGDGNWRGIE